ncbi:phosphatidylinositol 3,4,5-trisphosphate 3-phosphatase TPTE2-like [Cryptosporidium felis]|nr:phosphatidylinositol 3,4,5-trisphosphate 3-phosphatase TPTE2-like [Cryptosporidium felis]
MRNEVNLLQLLQQSRIEDFRAHSKVGIIFCRITKTASSPVVHWMVIFLSIIHAAFYLATLIGKDKQDGPYGFFNVYSAIGLFISAYCAYDSCVILVYICKLLKVKYGVSGYLKDEYIILRNSLELLVNFTITIASFTGLDKDIVGIGKILGYLLNWKRLSIFLRKQVGQNKRFYTSGEYCLDLVFITDRVIAMGLPAISIEAIYRNPIEEVSTFFMTKYPRSHMIINLCNEREHYSLSYFHSIVSCPFPDHQVPTLASLFIICFLVLNYLVNDPKNVVAVHCKGGKGRTGIVVVAWLLYSRLCSSSEEALDYYSRRRTDLNIPGRIKTIKNPSQIRFIHYFFFLLKNSFTQNPVRRSSNFFWEDLQRGFRSGYFWNVCYSELRRVNQKGEKRHWKIHDLLKDQCISLPLCLLSPVRVFPVSIVIRNKERPEEIFEWRICLHSEYNRNAEYLFSGLTTSSNWNPHQAGIPINKSLAVSGNGFQVLFADSENHIQQALAHFKNDRALLLHSASSQAESLVSTLKTRPFPDDLVSRPQHARPMPWVEREFAIKIFGQESLQKQSLKKVASPTPSDPQDASCSQTSEGSSLLQKEDCPRPTLRSISLIDLSNPERKEELGTGLTSALNSPYKDIVGFPIRKINEWGASRHSFSKPSVALAHFWLHPALIHISSLSNFWTFFLEWESSSKTWLVRHCFLSISLKTDSEVDIRSPYLDDTFLDVTFQYR